MKSEPSSAALMQINPNRQAPGSDLWNDWEQPTVPKKRAVARHRGY
jgi:hypothetical protein